MHLLTKNQINPIINANYLRKLFALIRKKFMPEKLKGYRKEIFDILNENEKPMSVREIYSNMETKPDYSTVYRAMDYFVKKHNVKHITFCDNVKFYFLRKNKNAHFLHCVNCHKTIEIKKCFVGKAEEQISREYDFKINDHFLYFMGVCSNCRSL